MALRSPLTHAGSSAGELVTAFAASPGIPYASSAWSASAPAARMLPPEHNNLAVPLFFETDGTRSPRLG